MPRDLDRTLEWLLVEDNPVDATLFQMILTEAKVKVRMRHVGDGCEALRVLHSSAVKPDLVLLDLNMPKMSGHEVLHEMKHDQALKAIPVVILSCSTDPSDILAAYENGASSDLCKAGDIDQAVDLVAVISNYWVSTAHLPRGTIGSDPRQH